MAKRRVNPMRSIWAQLNREAPDISEGLTNAGISSIRGMSHFRFVDDKGYERSVATRTYSPQPLTPDLLEEFHEAGFEVFGPPENHLVGRIFAPAPDDIECCQCWQLDAANHGLESCGSHEFMRANFSRRTTKKGKQ